MCVRLRLEISGIKELLDTGKVKELLWSETCIQLADCLTKRVFTLMLMKLESYWMGILTCVKFYSFNCVVLAVNYYLVIEIKTNTIVVAESSGSCELASLRLIINDSNEFRTLTRFAVFSVSDWGEHMVCWEIKYHCLINSFHSEHLNSFEQYRYTCM